MRNFAVTFQVLGETILEVMANDIDEAKTKATEKVTYDNFVLGDIELIDIEENEYNDYYPTEKEFPTAEIEEIITKHDLIASDAIMQLARACWAECKIYQSTSKE